MLANNLDVINLAIFEREEALRRQGRAIMIGASAATTPWSALLARVGRFFGWLGGAPVGASSSTAPGAAVNDRPAPQPLTLIHLPAAIADEAIDRAA